MIKSQAMPLSAKGNACGRGLLLSLFMLVCLFLSAKDSPGVQSNEPEWEPTPLAEIASIWEDKALTDIEIVRALVAHLDERISMSRIADRAKHRPNPPYEYVVLIRFIAERPYPAKPKGRPEAIATVIESLGSLENANEVRSYLYLALGLAGGTPPEREVLQVLESPKTPNEITAIALEAMSQSNVPIRSLPMLLQLSLDPTSYVHSPGVGPQVPRRVFPIRERVYDCLLRLDIKCQKTAQEDKEIDPVSQRRLSTTMINVDRGSLKMRLRTWLLDDDPDVWQAAMDAAARISGNDLDDLLSELASKGMLSADKLRYLRD